MLNFANNDDALVRFGGNILPSREPLSKRWIMAVEGILDASAKLTSSSRGELRSYCIPASSLS
jgi:hypothetical protein